MSQIQSKTRTLTALAAAVLVASGTASAAITMAIGEPTGTLRSDSYPFAGYGFYVPAGGSVNVNELGFWDQGGDGLGAAHTVTLYQYIAGSNKSYTALATVTIPAGTGATLDSGYRWLDIPTLHLTDNGQNGNYYVIMASQGGDAWTTGLGSGAPMQASFGTLSTGALDFGGGVGGNEINGSGATLYGGANFGFNPVPEISSAFIAGLGFCGLTLRRRRSA